MTNKLESILRNQYKYAVNREGILFEEDSMKKQFEEDVLNSKKLEYSVVENMENEYILFTYNKVPKTYVLKDIGGNKLEVMGNRNHKRFWTRTYTQSKKITL